VLGEAHRQRHLRGEQQQSDDPFQLAPAHVARLHTRRGLQKLTVVTPKLEHLTVLACFYESRNRPVADISARQLKVLRWGIFV
jgi:hypothetical protein